MSDDQVGCEWVSVSSGTGLPGLSRTKASVCVCVCVCACVRACVNLLFGTLYYTTLGFVCLDIYSVFCIISCNLDLMCNMKSLMYRLKTMFTCCHC